MRIDFMKYATTYSIQKINTCLNYVVIWDNLIKKIH